MELSAMGNTGKATAGDLVLALIASGEKYGDKGIEARSLWKGA